MRDPQQNLAALREYQAWRRGGDGPAPDPVELGKLLDWAIGVCEAASVVSLATEDRLMTKVRRLKDAVGAINA